MKRKEKNDLSNFLVFLGGGFYSKKIFFIMNSLFINEKSFSFLSKAKKDR